jgi:hypothetical protein
MTLDYSKKQRLAKNLGNLQEYQKHTELGKQNLEKSNGTVTKIQKNQIPPNHLVGQRNHPEYMAPMGLSIEDIEAFPVAMAYVPWQYINTVYDSHKALKIGTIFPELDLPFCGVRGGNV